MSLLTYVRDVRDPIFLVLDLWGVSHGRLGQVGPQMSPALASGTLATKGV